MALRIPWDIEESVLMLDALLKSLDGELTRKEAIHQVSEKLRKRAINKGIEIDDIFRNENGITFQMSAMEVAYTGVSTKLKQPTKLFIETVELYRNHREDYEEILREAEGMADQISMQDEFSSCQHDGKEYLSEEMLSPEKKDQSCKEKCWKTEISTWQKFLLWLKENHSSEEKRVLVSITLINTIGRKTHTLKKPLADISDPEEIKELIKSVSNSSMGFQSRKNVSAAIHALNLYAEFLRDMNNPDESKRGEQIDQPTEADQPISAAKGASSDCAEDNVRVSDEKLQPEEKQTSADHRTVDFDNIQSMAYTRPLSFSYFESPRKTVDNWTQLYVCFMNCMAEDYPHVLDANAVFSFGKKLRVDYGSGDAVQTMTVPKELENGCWIETNYSSTDIVKKIRFVLELCNVDFENVEIRYCTVDASKSATGKQEMTLCPASDCQDIWPDGKHVDFQENASYAFTKPLAFRYFGEKHLTVKSWKGLYVSLLQCLYQDYSDVFKGLVGTNLNDAGAIDFGNNGVYYTMRSPKIVADDIYVETNMDATDITKKLRKVLDLCNVDYSNVEIIYADTNDNTTAQPRTAAPLALKSPGAVGDERQKFNHWMRSTGMARATITSYMSSFGQCVRSAKEYKICEKALWGVTSAEEAERLYDRLFSIQEFYEYNKSQHNRFSAAFRKYIEFRSGGNPVDVRPMQPTYVAVEKVQARPAANDPVLIRYKELLEKFFPKGFRMDSSLEMKKLRRFYQGQYKTELAADDDLIDRDIRYVTIVHDNKAYLPDSMLSPEKKEKLEQYIADKFSSGCDAIYYAALFSEWEEEFHGERIYSPDMLKTYLSYINHRNYVIQRSYIARDYTVQMNPEDEVREYLKEYGGPVEVKQISAALSHITEQKIKSALNTQSDFIWNATGVYFHESCFNLSNSELEWISQFIENGIEDRNFVTGNELVEAVEVYFPDIKEMYQQITMIGKRNAIAYKLRDRFSFNGNIISRYGESLSMADVYAKYCRKRSRFTLDELNVLKQELNATIYFDEVYANSLRVSQNEFVSVDMAQFDTEATDKAIERFCTGQYMSIQAIRDFGTFPYAGYPWNEFLLEHFVANYSRKFMLLHIGYNANLCAGAVVKRASSFQDFNELLIDILANSDVVLNESAALEYLCQQGYIGRRRYSDIGKILAEAKVVRSKKG